MEIINIATAILILIAALIVCFTNNYRILLISLGIVIVFSSILWFQHSAKVLSILLIFGYGVPIIWLYRKKTIKNVFSNNIESKQPKKITQENWLMLSSLISVIFISIILVIKTISANNFFQLLANKNTLETATFSANFNSIISSFSDNYFISGILGIFFVITILILYRISYKSL